MFALAILLLMQGVVIIQGGVITKGKINATKIPEYRMGVGNPDGPKGKLNLRAVGELQNKGLDLFEGDIKMSPEDILRGHTRKAVADNGLLWPDRGGNPTVYYSIGNTAATEAQLQKAIDYYEENTCIKFVKTGFLFFGQHVWFGKGEGCSSKIGRKPGIWSFFFGQRISIDNGCQDVNIIIHEIGHAIGLYHEQSRSDRDKSVKPILDNVLSGKEHNFQIANTKQYRAPYDLTSVMQYGPLAFSSGDTTLTTLNPLYFTLMAMPRNLMSHMDLLQVNSMYKCEDRWKTACSIDVGVEHCKNLGYLGRDCKCVCPLGTSGTNCETLQYEYTEAQRRKYLPHSILVSSFSQHSLVTSNYPDPDDGSIFVTRMYSATSNCERVTITVEDFDFEGRASDNTCFFQGLEIRLGVNWVTSGKWFCGNELSKNQKLVTEGPILVLSYVKQDIISSKRGFKFIIDKEPIPGCT